MLTEDVGLDPRPQYIRAIVRWDNKEQGLVAETTGGQRSSRVGSLLRANALLCMPALGDEKLGEKRRKRKTVPMGDKVVALLMGQIGGAGD